MKNHKKLTPKETKFAINRAYGQTQIDAYKNAGYGLARPQTMVVEASRIDNKPHIKAKIVEIRDKLKTIQGKEFLWDRKKATKRLMGILEETRRQRAVQDNIFADTYALVKSTHTMLKCIKDLNKLWGLYDNANPEKPLSVVIAKNP